MTDRTPAASSRGAGSAAEAEPAEAPERAVALDMVRRSVLFAVPALLAGAMGWRWAGFWSVGLALGLVLVNFMLGAAAIGWGARFGPGGMMGAVLGGYIVRLGIVAAAVLPFVRHDWFEPLPFAVSLLVTHIGLLVVESRHVAASAAFPGLKPGREFPSRRGPSRTTSSAMEPSSRVVPSSMREPAP